MTSRKSLVCWFKTTSFKTAAIAVCLLVFGSMAIGEDAVATILMDGKMLAKTKQQIEKGNPTLKPAFDHLIADAEEAMNAGPYSVTDKLNLPPSGNKHDYASFSRYWWPDPNQPDGLPYIRRDGETNPDSQNRKKSDRSRIEAMGNDTETLALAYYFTANEKYAEKAAELLRVWFLDPETRMNPHLKFAQARPGHNVGTCSGVLDGRTMIKALDGSILISDSGALSDTELEGLKNWAGEYFHWLTTDQLALEEAAAKNNHGSFYDAQTMYFALCCGNKEGAKEIAEQVVSKLILKQIQPDGSMPEELARTQSLFYSNYNLHALFLVASLSESVDVDVWNAGNSRLRVALDFLAPYIDQSKPWPHPTIDEEDPMDMFPILLMTDRVYPDGNYLQWMKTLPRDECKLRRENLVRPLMR